MAHSKCKNWIHLIFCTKYRAPLITDSAEHHIHEQLRHQLIQMKCYVDSVNGISDHVHLLFLLNPQKALSKVVQQIKGGSAFIINQAEWVPFKFEWSVGYAAYSVSESGVPSVRRYIKNQKEHHRKRSAQEEWDEYLRLHGLSDETEE